MRDRIIDVVNEIGARLLQLFERLIVRSSLVPTTPFLDPAIFPWVRTLEENWKTIRRELEDVLTYREQLPNFQDISTDQESITDDDRWKTFFFFGYGFKSEANCARCPETTQLLEQVPGMTTAFFSILSPHKHIPDHRGPYKGVLRYHLALMIPEPREACRIRVDDEFAHWDEGKSLLFDDSYDHEAWNDSDSIRVVLFMDVVRPLKPVVGRLNTLVIRAISKSPYVGDAKRRHRNWETKFEEWRSRR
jgi:beta-hydroxylase